MLLAENKMKPEEIKQLIKEAVRQEVNFSSRKLADTPTDDLMVTPRGYVNLSGDFADRPISSVATLGQQYFATDLNYPVFRGTASWFSASGSIVGA